MLQKYSLRYPQCSAKNSIVASSSLQGLFGVEILFGVDILFGVEILFGVDAQKGESSSYHKVHLQIESFPTSHSFEIENCQKEGKSIIIGL